MTFAVTIHLASGQSVRGELEEYDVKTEESALAFIESLLYGPPGWRRVAGLLIYSQVVSAIEVEQIGGSQ